MNSRDEPEKTFKVALPDNNHATVYVRDAMSVEEFLASACARKNLNPMEHFVRVKKRRDMEDHNYFVPHRNDLIETYVSVRLFCPFHFDFMLCSIGFLFFFSPFFCLFSCLLASFSARPPLNSFSFSLVHFPFAAISKDCDSDCFFVLLPPRPPPPPVADAVRPPLFNLFICSSYLYLLFCSVDSIFEQMECFNIFSRFWSSAFFCVRKTILFVLIKYFMCANAEFVHFSFYNSEELGWGVGWVCGKIGVDPFTLHCCTFEVAPNRITARAPTQKRSPA